MAYSTEDIVSYLNGRMSAAEATAFEQAIVADPGLAEEVENQRKLSRLVQIATLKNRLNDIQDEFAVTPAMPVESRNQKKSWGWIAAAAVIAGIGLFLMFYQSPYDKVFNTWFSDDPGAPSLMGNNEATPFDKAMVYYKSGDYEAAEQGFKQLLSTDAKNDTITYYEALSLVRLKREPEALSLLRSISVSDAWKLNDKATWYYALVLIHQKKAVEAAKPLRAIAGSKSEYADKAKQVLGELKDKKLID